MGWFKAGKPISTDHRPSAASVIQRVSLEEWNAETERTGLPCGLKVEAIDRERLLLFLNRWRDRLLKDRHADQLNDEQLGQLITLNTIIGFVQDRQC